jgi:hypothetical protein
MKNIALLTQHGKEDAVKLPLQQAGFAVHTVSGFDTDTLGTFTGETARAGSQVDAATTKARLATEISGERYGLGSEGSFGPDPYIGLSGWGREVLVWWDVQDQRAVFALAQGAATNYAQTTISDWGQAQAFAREAGYPAHGVVVGKPGSAVFSKDCKDWPDLEQTVRFGLEKGPVWLETDMRAHRNPMRRAMIAQCAQELSRLLQCACPSCSTLGFGEDTPLNGAICESCGGVTSAVRARKTRCNVCGHTATVVLQATVAASRCERCNP